MADELAQMGEAESYEGWQALAADTLEKRGRWRSDRQPHEQEWFINAAMYRGNHYVEWNDRLSRLTTPKAPPHRVRLKINRLQAKLRARLSKWLKNRPRVVVVPATQEYQDYLNAKATQKVLDYQWRRARLERKLKEALLWAQVCGKGFWWLHWNPRAIGRVAVQDPLTGRMTYDDRPLGDVLVEVGSSFEVLVADQGITHLGDQPEIMRLKLRDVDTLRQRYPYAADDIQASGSEESFFAYEQQIAGLNPYSFSSPMKNAKQREALVTEHFIRPCAAYPNGHYRVLAGSAVVYAQDELPSGMGDMENPYPVVEFFDLEQAGQFWTPTICSQLVDLQKEYNLLRSKLAENLRVMAHPKILVARQHQLPKSSWTCVDEETTVLSERGWVNYRELAVGDRVWAYDAKAQVCGWEACTAVNVHAFAGELVRLQNRNIDALVTGNHRWYVEQAKPDRRFEQRVVTTEGLADLPKGGWRIPLARAGRLPHGGDPARFELLGWIAAEGTFTPLGALHITQYKPEGRARIEALLREVGVAYTAHPRHFYVWKADAQELIGDLLPDKRLRWEVLAGATQEELEAFFTGVMAGDGTVGTNGHRKLSNTNVALCEQVSAIAAMLGMRASIVQEREAHEKFFPEPYGGKVYACAAQYAVHLGGPGGENLNVQVQSLQPRSEAYVGVVWCPTVPSGAVTFKRNGRVFISGNSEAGEIIEYVAVPSLPPPQPWTPPNIAADLWQAVALLQREFDDVSQVFPAAEGKTGNATSGFQTNLLQEATDSVHAPDIRTMEMSVEEAMQKLRRLVKENYTVPRLIAVVGANYEAEVLEFSSAQVDEQADVIVEIGSALPTLKAAKQEAVLNIYKSGLLGSPQDPEVQRRTLSLLEMGSVEQVFNAARADEHQAELENMQIARGILTEDPPRFWENHSVHYNFHILKLKSAETRNWRPEQVRALIAHAILHARFINPQSALQMAVEERITEVIPTIQAMLMQAGGGSPAGAEAAPAAPPAPSPVGPRG